jgi:Mrp family chromosome partitioning ATPase
VSTVGKYYDAMNRIAPRTEDLNQRMRQRDAMNARTEELPARQRYSDTALMQQQETVQDTTSLVPLPTPHQVPGSMAREDAIRQLTERMAPAASVDKSCRLAISGCRSQDGASSLAAALAIDLSQRLSMRTILVDANLHRPGLHRLVSNGDRKLSPVALDGALQLRSTGWPRLTLATCCLHGDDRQRDSMVAELENVLATFPAVVIDLGVARLDSRMLPLVRPSDPILLVVRYGQTERQELITTTAALRAADRTVAGVILNGAASPVADIFRRQPSI